MLRCYSHDILETRMQPNWLPLYFQTESLPISSGHWLTFRASHNFYADAVQPITAPVGLLPNMVAYDMTQSKSRQGRERPGAYEADISPSRHSVPTPPTFTHHIKSRATIQTSTPYGMMASWFSNEPVVDACENHFLVFQSFRTI